VEFLACDNPCYGATDNNSPSCLNSGTKLDESKALCFYQKESRSFLSVLSRFLYCAVYYVPPNISWKLYCPSCSHSFRTDAQEAQYRLWDCRCLTRHPRIKLLYKYLLLLYWTYGRASATTVTHSQCSSRLCLRCIFFLIFSSSAVSESESESYVTTDGQSASPSWYKAPIRGLRPDFFSVRNTECVWQLRSWFRGSPSLTRGRVCLLYVPLVLASAVFLGSESLGIRDHILLSQILDLPLRRLIRLAGPRWRYSTSPPHGYLDCQLHSPLSLSLSLI
jgi:hypothetical protein